VQEDSGQGEKRLRLRYPGTCRACGTALPGEAEATYERATKTIRCATHELSGPLQARARHAQVSSATNSMTPCRSTACCPSSNADGPLIGGSFTTRGIEGLWQERLHSILRSEAPIDVEAIARIHRALAAALPLSRLSVPDRWRSEHSAEPLHHDGHLEWAPSALQGPVEAAAP
jgi:hypothetical protein